MDITSSTEKLAVPATHVSVSHKLCQAIQFLPYSASAKYHEENSKIWKLNIHKWNLTVAELLHLRSFLNCIYRLKDGFLRLQL